MPRALHASRYQIVVDWGTTTFRAVLVDEQGQVEDTVHSARGISQIAPATHEAELMAHIGGWIESRGPLRVLALGMITSRNGWVEVPYVPCPANAADLARGAIRRALPGGSQLVFLPGITDLSRRPWPDVMRGEETQIVGFGLQRQGTVVLPGTHSKWARVEDGYIVGFQTFVTGELYGLLASHSFIARGAQQVASPESFDQGVQAALSQDAEAAALPTLLFSARTGMLARALKAEQMADYVSGVLIGHEFRQAEACGWLRDRREVAIVGDDGLNARYGRAARLAGLGVVDGGETAALAGALSIARYLDDSRQPVGTLARAL